MNKLFYSLIFTSVALFCSLDTIGMELWRYSAERNKLQALVSPKSMSKLSERDLQKLKKDYEPIFKQMSKVPRRQEEVKRLKQNFNDALQARQDELDAKIAPDEAEKAEELAAAEMARRARADEEAAAAQRAHEAALAEAELRKQVEREAAARAERERRAAEQAAREREAALAEQRKQQEAADAAERKKVRALREQERAAQQARIQEEAEKRAAAAEQARIAAAKAEEERKAREVAQRAQEEQQKQAEQEAAAERVRQAVAARQAAAKEAERVAAAAEQARVAEEERKQQEAAERARAAQAAKAKEDEQRAREAAQRAQEEQRKQSERAAAAAREAERLAAEQRKQQEAAEKTRLALEEQRKQTEQATRVPEAAAVSAEQQTRTRATQGASVPLAKTGDPISYKKGTLSRKAMHEFMEDEEKVINERTDDAGLITTNVTNVQQRELEAVAKARKENQNNAAYLALLDAYAASLGRVHAATAKALEAKEARLAAVKKEEPAESADSAVLASRLKQAERDLTQLLKVLDAGKTSQSSGIPAALNVYEDENVPKAASNIQQISLQAQQAQEFLASQNFGRLVTQIYGLLAYFDTQATPANAELKQRMINVVQTFYNVLTDIVQTYAPKTQMDVMYPAIVQQYATTLQKLQSLGQSASGSAGPVATPAPAAATPTAATTPGIRPAPSQTPVIRAVEPAGKKGENVQEALNALQIINAKLAQGTKLQGQARIKFYVDTNIRQDASPLRAALTPKEASELIASPDFNTLHNTIVTILQLAASLETSEDDAKRLNLHFGSIWLLFLKRLNTATPVLKTKIDEINTLTQQIEVANPQRALQVTVISPQSFETEMGHAYGPNQNNKLADNLKNIVVYLPSTQQKSGECGPFAAINAWARQQRAKEEKKINIWFESIEKKFAEKGNLIKKPELKKGELKKAECTQKEINDQIDSLDLDNTFIVSFEPKANSITLQKIIGVLDVRGKSLNDQLANSFMEFKTGRRPWANFIVNYPDNKSALAAFHNQPVRHIVYMNSLNSDIPADSVEDKFLQLLNKETYPFATREVETILTTRLATLSSKPNKIKQKLTSRDRRLRKRATVA